MTRAWPRGHPCRHTSANVRPCGRFFGNREPRVFSNYGKWSNPSRFHGDGAQSGESLSGRRTLTDSVPRRVYYSHLAQRNKVMTRVSPDYYPEGYTELPSGPMLARLACRAEEGAYRADLPHIVRFWLHFAPFSSPFSLVSPLFSTAPANTPRRFRCSCLPPSPMANTAAALPPFFPIFIGGKNSLRWSAPDASGTQSVYCSPRGRS